MGYNSKELKASPLEKKQSKPKDVIVDPAGQWKYPGQVTKIPSNHITMEGVPYPVLGVDNLGNHQMMYPGFSYIFAGENVTEYPQMQRGGTLGPRSRTPKNIQSSINELMLRNYQLFGYLGRNIYDPDTKKGRNMKKLKQGGDSGAPHNGQPTAAQFFNPGWIPQGPVGFYMHGGINTPEAFPQQPTADVFFSAAPWSFGNGGQPCYECGGYMQYGGPREQENLAAWQQEMSGKGYIQKPFNKKRMVKLDSMDTPIGPITIPTDIQGYNKGMNYAHFPVPQYTPAGTSASGVGLFANPQGQNFYFGQGEYKPYTQPSTEPTVATFKSGGNWIQKATASIKRRGTEGVCTGSKFGGPSCPPGSRRYNLAKTFRAMAKKAKGGETVDGMTEDDFISKYNDDFLGAVRDNVWMNLADETAENIANSEEYQMGGSYGYNPNMFNQSAFGNQASKIRNQGVYDLSNFVGATNNLYDTANPYTQWSSEQIPMAQMGMVFSPMNANPYMNWHARSQGYPTPTFAFNPNNTYLQNYEYRGRLFGKGPRKVSMTFRTFTDPATGEKRQMPVPAEQSKGQGQGNTSVSPFQFGFPAKPGLYDVQNNPNGGNENFNNPTRRMGIENMMSGNLYRQPVWAAGPENEPYDQFPGQKTQAGPFEKKYGGKAQMGRQVDDRASSMSSNYFPQPESGVTPGGGADLNGNYFDTVVTGKRKMGLDNEALANWMLAGSSGLASVLEQKDARNAANRMKSLQGADANFAATQGNRGFYGQTGSYNGIFDPMSMVPVQFPGQNFGQMGSPYQYQEGGEYDLTEEQIQQILANGGSVEYL